MKRMVISVWSSVSAFGGFSSPTVNKRSCVVIPAVKLPFDAPSRSKTSRGLKDSLMAC